MRKKSQRKINGVEWSGGEGRGGEGKRYCEEGAGRRGGQSQKYDWPQIIIIA